jgi:hypothetical protein
MPCCPCFLLRSCLVVVLPCASRHPPGSTTMTLWCVLLCAVMVTVVLHWFHRCCRYVQYESFLKLPGLKEICTSLTENQSPHVLETLPTDALHLLTFAVSGMPTKLRRVSRRSEVRQDVIFLVSPCVATWVRCPLYAVHVSLR